MTSVLRVDPLDWLSGCLKEGDKLVFPIRKTQQEFTFGRKNPEFGLFNVCPSSNNQILCYLGVVCSQDYSGDGEIV